MQVGDNQVLQNSILSWVLDSRRRSIKKDCDGEVEEVEKKGEAWTVTNFNATHVEIVLRLHYSRLPLGNPPPQQSFLKVLGLVRG